MLKKYISNLCGVCVVGGMGKRLKSFTIDRPKAMLQVGTERRPMLEFVVKPWVRLGVKNYVFCTGYKSEVIEGYFKDGNKLDVKINYSKEKTNLETGGAIKNAMDNKILNKNSQILVFYCDDLVRLDLFNLLKKHEEIPAGDLLFSMFFAEGVEYLAILKLDYIDSYTHQIGMIENELSVNLITQETSLPTGSSRIKKCAFFKLIEDDELEIMGTDTRRQTNLDGLIRLPANEQLEVLKYLKPKIIETGHIAATTKESIIEKIFTLGEKFVKTTQKECPPGIIGPFALQGAIAADRGKEEMVVFDVSMRIPGSPLTRFTPHSC